ncbi:hypothetical protein ABFS82_01G080500 [Erythranthe guttata]|uniref:Aminotransferase class V domain-containing protein n=1 Tax=Erythranthe guttata TaxID=4155 RepID=A0A022RFN2_ERYGU|nr:PREDICTED: molybdenum cofactor sulfurase-like [Erythranthe guttata]EYU39001.1 hypothetical protein MIMGU_mgv1a003296mg [Erythranthe guttata]|eukprot:XP_012835487.1 PREDICTED: molybdenum cofactor sulfurase-like [Erythranthe guttata]
MESNCIRESSKACFNTCCINPLLSLPEPHSSSPPNSAVTVDPRRNFISAILSSIQPPNAVFTNHESLPSSTELFSSLKNAVLNYSNTVLSDDIRARDYYHLTVSNHVCLDYVGHGLFSYSQKPKYETATSSSSSSSDDAPFFDISYNSVNLNSYLQYGNQESEFQAKIRKRIIAYMNLYEEDYSLVFTANQSSAFKILADSYPFQSNQNLLTVYDYENEAVRAMVDSATKRGARVQSAVFSWPNFRVNAKKLRKIVVGKSQSKNKNKKKGLFVFPLQSRMTGSRYSYQWMNLARENGWHVLLDASALGAKDMETLGLSLFQPDFIICSFFKIFGENPSGFCCLFIKKSSISDLTQSSKSTGIISIKGPIESSAAIDEPPTSSASTSQQIIITKSPEIQEIDEKAPELTTEPKKTLEIEFRGLDHADELGLILISNRLRCLINWLVNALMCLRHPHSGVPLIGIYGPRIKLERGPAVAFNVYDWKGERVDPILVQKLADRNNISVSVGFLKNIWFDEGFKEERGIVLENRRTKKKKKRREKSDCGVGAVAISIGMLNNFEDVYRIWGFVARFLDADFVEKERWRYTALNQTTVEI